MCCGFIFVTFGMKIIGWSISCSFIYSRGAHFLKPLVGKNVKSQSTSEYFMKACLVVIYSLAPKLYWSEQRKLPVMKKVLGPGVAVNIVKVMYNCAK